MCYFYKHHTHTHTHACARWSHDHVCFFLSHTSATLLGTHSMKYFSLFSVYAISQLGGRGPRFLGMRFEGVYPEAADPLFKFLERQGGVLDHYT